MYIVNDGLSPSDDSPSFTNTSGSQTLLSAGNQVRRQLPFVIRPKRIATQDRNTVSRTPEWVESERQVISYQCYDVSSLILPECTVKLTDMDMVEHNYERFSEKQKTLLRNDLLYLAEKYLEMKCNFAIPTCNNKAQPQNESKN